MSEPLRPNHLVLPELDEMESCLLQRLKQHLELTAERLSFMECRQVMYGIGSAQARWTIEAAISHRLMSRSFFADEERLHACCQPPRLSDGVEGVVGVVGVKEAPAGNGIRLPYQHADAIRTELALRLMACGTWIDREVMIRMLSPSVPCRADLARLLMVRASEQLESNEQLEVLDQFELAQRFGTQHFVLWRFPTGPYENFP